MSKKMIIPIVVIILVVVAVVVFLVVKNNVKVELNLQELNSTISEIAPFNEMATMDVDADTLNALYDINEELYEEVIGKMPMMNVQASMYLVIKAKDGEVEAVKEKVNNYASNQEEMWATYLPEQYELVKERKTGVIGNYVYLIIGESASEIEKIINK